MTRTQSWWEWIFRARELSLIVVIVALVVITTLTQPQYLFSEGGVRDLLRTPALYIALAVGEAIVIITRNIDLSIGSILGLSAYFCGNLFHQAPALPIPVVILLTVLFGGILGSVNGLLVAFLKVPALVITLGTLYAYRGIAVLWIGGNFIRPEWVPKEFTQLALSGLFGVPWLLIVAVVVVLLAAWFMTSRRTGRELYAIGSNPDAAVLYGLRTRRLTLLPFVISGTLAGVAGVIYVSIYATGDSKVGLGLELQAVAAAVVGGVAVVGGAGRIWGVALGAFFLATLTTALPVLSIPSLWQQAVVGVLIVGAITLDRVFFVVRQRQARKGLSA
ncbi:MAG: ABC transporter permease [Pseudolysinimonas sp.]|uniref:ABC transporter permease n=1 Tax=Pseudolysinimonas sp. TaxID=2680009 RepID=UPI003263CC8F